MKFLRILFYVVCLSIFAAVFAQAAILVVLDDNYGIPASKVLMVEPFGVLDNDTLDDQNAGEEGVTVTLLTGVSKGVLTCPDPAGPGLCVDGSFEYIPNMDPFDIDMDLFDGEDTFQYLAVAASGESATATVTLSACSGGPAVFSCWHKKPYRAKLAELGYNLFLESFNGTAWDIVRSPDIGTSVTAPSITSKGITWTTNHPLTNGITTGSGPARSGLWGAFDPEHGLAAPGTVPSDCDIDNPPVECHPYDGFSGSGTALHAVGGYFSGFSGANVAIIIDGTNQGGGILLDAGYHFFGVIDTAGFTEFEFRELDGKVGQELLIFGDDFIIATTDPVATNNPPELALIGDRSVNENILLTIELMATDTDDGDSLIFSMTGTPAGSEFSNNFDGTATFSWRPDFNQAGSYDLDFIVTDNGLPPESDSELITITIVDVVDVTKPVITLLGSNPVNIELGTTYIDDGATATDNIDGDISLNITPTSTVNTNATGSYTVTYNVSDTADNPAMPVVRTVNVTITAGDINGNGTVGLEDMIMVLQTVTGLTPPGIYLEADIDENGRIGLSEAIFVLRKVAGLP